MTDHCPVCRQPGTELLRCDICSKAFGCRECIEGTRCSRHRVDLNPFQLGVLPKGSWKLQRQFEQGCRWAEQGRWEEADRRFRLLMAKDPSHHFPRFALARVKAETSDPQAALKLLEAIEPGSRRQELRISDLRKWCSDELEGYG